MHTFYTVAFYIALILHPPQVLAGEEQARRAPRRLVLDQPVSDFKFMIGNWDKLAPDMQLHIRDIKREFLPDYLFKEGARPPMPAPRAASALAAGAQMGAMAAPLGQQPHEQTPDYQHYPPPERVQRSPKTVSLFKPNTAKTTTILPATPTPTPAATTPTPQQHQHQQHIQPQYQRQPLARSLPQFPLGVPSQFAMHPPYMPPTSSSSSYVVISASNASNNGITPHPAVMPTQEGSSVPGNEASAGPKDESKARRGREEKRPSSGSSSNSSSSLSLRALSLDGVKRSKSSESMSKSALGQDRERERERDRDKRLRDHDHEGEHYSLHSRYHHHKGRPSTDNDVGTSGDRSGHHYHSRSKRSDKDTTPSTSSSSRSTRHSSHGHGGSKDSPTAYYYDKETGERRYY